MKRRNFSSSGRTTRQAARRSFVFVCWSSFYAIGSFGCAPINPPADMRVYAPERFNCTCEGMDPDFHIDRAWLVGGGLWIQMVDTQNDCAVLLKEMGK